MLLPGLRQAASGGGRTAEAEVLQQFRMALRCVVFGYPQHLDGQRLWALLFPGAPGVGMWPSAGAGSARASSPMVATVRGIA